MKKIGMPYGNRKLNLKSKVVLSKVYNYAKAGATITSICKALRIHYCTWQKYLVESEEFKKAYDDGVEAGIAEVELALFNNAVKEKNLGAQCFYLKNRAPDRWSDDKKEDPKPLVVQLMKYEEDL